jgi:outer membrane biosynthesis protein TonB
MVRRGLLLVGAVVGAVALGVAVAGPLAEPAPGERTVAVKSPLDSASASWSIGTPPPNREPRPSRGEERTTAPAAPVERPPSPTASAPEPSKTTDDRPSRSPSGSATPTPTQTNQGSPSPDDTTAPNTSATTTSLEDGAWTVTSTADESSSFECSLDGGEYAACGPNVTFDDLDNGKHTLAVRAVDEAGNVDPSPAELVANITGSLDD